MIEFTPGILGTIETKICLNTSKTHNTWMIVLKKQTFSPLFLKPNKALLLLLPL